MRDAFEALAAQDPAAVAYHHGDLAGLTTSIASIRVRPARAPRSFRAAVAATVATAGATTAALIALLAAGPTLPLIGFAAPRATVLYSTKSATVATGSVAARRPATRPVAGALGPGPSLAAAYRVTLPATSLRALERLGDALGVVGSIAGYNGTVYSETSPTGARVVYDTSTGLARWRYLPGPTSGLTPAALSRALANQHWGYAPVVPARGGSAAVVVDGSVTSLRVVAIVRSGHVVDAVGPAFAVAAIVNYPLRSPTSALAGLSSEIRARASSFTLTWTAFTLIDSTEWLLPTFVFRGRAEARPWTASALAIRAAAIGTGG